MKVRVTGQGAKRFWREGRWFGRATERTEVMGHTRAMWCEPGGQKDQGQRGVSESRQINRAGRGEGQTNSVEGSVRWECLREGKMGPESDWR